MAYSMNLLCSFNLVRMGFKFEATLDICLEGVAVVSGPSGSGKTSLLRLLSGLERPESGFLSVDKEVWQSDSYFLPTHSRPVGYVFQEPSLFPHLSVAKNISYGQKRSWQRKDVTLVQCAIDILKIGHLMDRSTTTLSGGEQQRVAIARAISTNPKILLMDEPLASLDQGMKEEALCYIRQLNEELKMPVIYVTHCQYELEQLADYLIVMDNGKIVSQSRTKNNPEKSKQVVGPSEVENLTLYATVVSHMEEGNKTILEFANGTMTVPIQNLETGSRVKITVKNNEVTIRTSDRQDRRDSLNLRRRGGSLSG